MGQVSGFAAAVQLTYPSFGLLSLGKLGPVTVHHMQ